MAALDVSATAKPGFRVAFYVCGMPAGITAGFEPASATADLDPGSPTNASAHSTLHTSTAWTVLGPKQYILSLHAYFQDESGARTSQGNANGIISSRSVVLTLKADGTTTLAPSDAQVEQQGPCSAVPAGFEPVPTPTPSPSDISVSASVSNQHPAPNERVTVTGKILIRGQPLGGVIMHATWYGPYGTSVCDGASSYVDGTAQCSMVNDRYLPGYTVVIQVTFQYNNVTYTALTSYTPL
jgi:hypothetical protein